MYLQLVRCLGCGGVQYGGSVRGVHIWGLSDVVHIQGLSAGGAGEGYIDAGGLCQVERTPTLVPVVHENENYD